MYIILENREERITDANQIGKMSTHENSHGVMYVVMPSPILIHLDTIHLVSFRFRQPSSTQFLHFNEMWVVRDVACLHSSVTRLDQQLERDGSLQEAASLAIFHSRSAIMLSSSESQCEGSCHRIVMFPCSICVDQFFRNNMA